MVYDYLSGLRADSEGRISPMILQGFLRILSFFDVAEAIEMEKLRVILGPEATPRSPAFTHRSPEYAQTQQHAPIVESVGPVTLSSGEIIPAQTVVWCGGMRACPLAAALPGTHDALGRLAVDDFMRVKGLANVFAAGDAAWSMPDGVHPTVMSC